MSGEAWLTLCERPVGSDGFVVAGAYPVGEAGLAELAERAVARSATADVWVSTNGLGGRPPAGYKGRERAVRWWVGLHEDVDKGIEDPAAWLRGLDVPPSMLVDSGYGVHAYWTWQGGPVDLAEADELEELQRLQGRARLLAARWHTRLLGKAGATFDNCTNLDRVMRLPGTLNWKDPEQPRLVRLLGEGGDRFTPSSLKKRLDVEGIPASSSTGSRADEMEAEQAEAAYAKRGSLRDEEEHAVVERLVRRYVERANRYEASGGSRNRALFDLAQQLNDHYVSQEAARDAVVYRARLEVTELDQQGRHAPLTVGEVETVVASAYALPPRGPARIETRTEVASQFRRVSISELKELPRDLRWAARGLLTEHTYGVDSGEEKSFKSYLGLARAVGLAAGVPVLGRWDVPERRRVLLYVGEGGRIPFTSRLEAMCRAYGLELDELDGWLETIYGTGPADSEPFRDSLKEHLDQFQPALVHLDPWYPFQPRGVDSHRYADVGAALGELHSIVADGGASLWITAHMNQSGEGLGLNRISGAGIQQWADSWCMIKLTERDIPNGRVTQRIDVGSRQWGGQSYEVDWQTGVLNAETGQLEGEISFTVRLSQQEEGDGRRLSEEQVHLQAKQALIKAGKRQRGSGGWTKDEWIKERAKGKHEDLRAAWGELIDLGQIVPVEGTGQAGERGVRYRLEEDKLGFDQLLEAM